MILLSAITEVEIGIVSPDYAIIVTASRREK